MKKQWYFLAVISLLLSHSLSSNAQVPVRTGRDTLLKRGDTSRSPSDSTRRRGRGMAALFADTAKLTSSDYQLQIEKTYVILDNIDNKSELGLTFTDIQKKLTDNDSVLLVIKDNLLTNSQALSLRNLQVFQSLLQNIQADLKNRREQLDSTEALLGNLRKSLQVLVSDTVLKQLQRDSVLSLEFAPQLKAMRESWRSTTRRLRKSFAAINGLQTHASSNAITTSQLLEKVHDLQASSASRIFGKEFNMLWERDTVHLTQSARSSFRKAYSAEQKALRYYFKDSGYKRLFLLFVGLLFFFWVYRNVRTLRRAKTHHSIDQMGFDYLPTSFILSSFVIMLCLAPLFDLHAPSAYIESVQFLLLIILTIICWRKWPRRLFVYWVAMAALFILFSLTHHVHSPETWHRLLLILLNALSIVFGLLFLSQMKDHLNLRSFLRFVIILHNIMNVLAIVCNIFGRVTLAQILGSAAIFSFMQAIGLAVFSKICLEATLLQIVTSRFRKGLKSRFEYQHVLSSFGKPILFLVIILWLIVFTNNLNIYTWFYNGVVSFLQTSRNIGSASFTVGGILLFFLIIWIAHLLQKYVGYFFGDTGVEEDAQNKKQRSRLLIARLIVLCIGYLLAVAASGVPVDKITIVLGALGVGIGLGLQNIVNNFVSGIILIFDRPLQIGDLVEIGDKTGRVRGIGLRSSTLVTDDGAEVIIPNGDVLSQQITNWTLSNNQQRIEIDLSLTGNRDMEEVASAVKKTIIESDHVYENREPQVLFTKVNEDGFDLKVFFWCEDVLKSDEARSAVLILLHEKLKAANIHIK